MAMLRHEIWEQWSEIGDEAGWQPEILLAGPDGADAKRLHGPIVRYRGHIDAGSHFEAMTRYNEQLGLEPYASDHPGDREPYPDAMAVRQGIDR